MMGYYESDDGGLRSFSDRPDKEQQRLRAIRQVQESLLHASNPLATKQAGMEAARLLPGYWNWDHDWCLLKEQSFPAIFQALQELIEAKQEGESILVEEVLPPINAYLEAYHAGIARKAEEARRRDQEEVRMDDGESFFCRIRGRTGNTAYAVVGEMGNAQWFPILRHPNGYWVLDISRKET